MRGRLTPSFIAAALGAMVLATSVHAEDPASPGALNEVPLRGGLRAALNAIGDRAAADRSHFLIELIRRVHDMPATTSRPRNDLLQTLLTHLDRVPSTAQSTDTLPLPLHPDIWTNVVFGGKPGAADLVSAILGSRNSSLLYYGLISLDAPTRAWLARQPELIAEIASKHAAAFAVAAPGLHVRNNIVLAPGGEAANHIWQALVGRDPKDPAAFVRALLTQSQGHLAYFLTTLSNLTPAQVQFALKLDSSDASQAIDAARRLFLVFDRLAGNWIVDDRPFWRPTLDPALLIAELAPDAAGAPTLVGTRQFWKAVVENDAGRPRKITADEARALATGEPVDFLWLCEQVFKGGQILQRRPYEMVLFASRVVRQITPENVTDAIDAISGSGTFTPATTVLERAGVTDLATFAKTVRRAHQLSTIDDHSRASRALAQYQGSLALLTRAAQRKSLSTTSLSSLVSSLSALEPNGTGEYEGRVVRWWEEVISADLNSRRKGALSATGAAGANANADGKESSQYDDAVGSLDRDVIRFLSGPTVLQPRYVEWEGTRYRVDLSWAEATRLERMLGEHPRPYLSSALALVHIAEALSDPGLTRETVREQTTIAEQVHQRVAGPALEKATATLRSASRDGDNRPAQRLASVASTFRAIADDLFARGVTEIVYAVAMGQPDGALVAAGDAAARHDFGLRLFGPMGAWRFPVSGADRMRDWHVTGSLLALDVRLADFALMKVSSRPPPIRPTLNDADRRVLIEAVALVEGNALTDDDRDLIVATIRKGRERLAAAKSAADWTAIADEIRLNGPRRSLLPWTAAHDSDRVAGQLSPSELLWLGLESKPVDARLNAWGVSAEARAGCLCLRLTDRRPLETFAGRWDSGMFASGFADLNLRLAELLAEMHMPAPLLPSVLAAATLDFINGVVSRGQDDRRGLVEYVYALQPDRLELYLALLTTDGPLVVVEEVTAETVRKTEVSR